MKCNGSFKYILNSYKYSGGAAYLSGKRAILSRRRVTCYVGSSPIDGVTLFRMSSSNGHKVN